MINGLLFALFVLLQCVDFYTTYTIIKTGKGHEANPILAKIFDKIGYPAGLALIKGGAIAFAFYLVQFSNAYYILGIADVIYIYVIFNNIKVMKGN
jgi:hypothetical protein